MQLLFRLPFLLLESLVRQGLSALSLLTRLVRGGDDGAETAQAPSAAPPPRTFTGDDDVDPGGPPPPTAEETLQRRFTREARTTSPRVGTPPTGGHVDREATVVESVGPAEDVHGTITVDAPWADYDRLGAGEIVSRLRDADDATRGVVRLYERTHKNRATVVRATG
jgi:hypothetical protein